MFYTLERNASDEFLYNNGDRKRYPPSPRASPQIFSRLSSALVLDQASFVRNPPPRINFRMPAKNSSTITHPPLGTFIDGGALELVEVLGVGGYGVVYRAIDTRSTSSKSYAVKCLVDAKAQQSCRQRQAHMRETTLHQLASSHPNVVTLHRVVEEFYRTYIIMDYASDGDLFTQILHNCRYLGDDHLIKDIFLQLLDAVEYCHSLGIYHRDLKPENVLCFKGGLKVAITDFGLATTDKVSEEFRTGSVYHMSPECQGGAFAPTGTYSPMFNDIWSLAIILLNLATGRNPWKSATASDPTFQAYLHDPTRFLPTVLPISDEINAILVRMLEPDWRDRMTLPELRLAIQDVDNFYSDGVVFEGSMARCPWEAGMDMEESESSTKAESVPPPKQKEQPQEELKSHWSEDSRPTSELVFASPAAAEAESSSYGQWSGHPSCAATWGFESPSSSTGSQEATYKNNVQMWDDSPPTPQSTRSQLSPSSSKFGSSLPATPNFDSAFADRVNVIPAHSLKINTDFGRSDFANRSMASFSTGTSMMQTAIDYTYSPSYFFASPVAKNPIAASPYADLGADDDDEDDMEMDAVSAWEYPVTDVSYSMYSATPSSCGSLVNEIMECDMRSPNSPSPDTILWPDHRAHHQPQQPFLNFDRPSPMPVPYASSVREPPQRSSSPGKSSESGAKNRTGIFSNPIKFFPRGTGSSPSSVETEPPHRTQPLESFKTQVFCRSRTPSPPPRQPWSFATARAAQAQQESNFRAAARMGPKRHWFSPGKLFS